MYTNEDDINFFIQARTVNVNMLMNAIEEFGAILWYTLNVNKSELMVMGCTISDKIKYKYTFH